MTETSRSIGLVVAGVVLALVSASADALGIGSHPGFGWKQLAGTGVGVLVAGIGSYGLRSATGRS